MMEDTSFRLASDASVTALSAMISATLCAETPCTHKDMKKGAQPAAPAEKKSTLDRHDHTWCLLRRLEHA